jgi:hypothetical protein
MKIKSVVSLINIVVGLSAFAATPRDSVIYELSDDADEMQVHVRAQGKLWSLLWDYVDGDNYKQATIKQLSPNGGDDLFNYSSQVTISKVENGEVVGSKRDEVSHVNGESSIKIVAKDNSIRLYAGDGTRCIADAVLMHFDGMANSKVIFREEQPIKRLNIDKEILYRVHGEKSSFSSKEELDEYLAHSTDSIEGYWQYLDRNIDAPAVQLGGYYELATVRNDGGYYEIVYVDGADKYSSLWKPLQLKGKLIGTIFQNSFDLEWVDAKRTVTMKRDVYVSFEQKSIMTVHFPLLNSEIRFSRKRR